MKIFRPKKNSKEISNFLLNLRNKKYVRANSLNNKLIKINKKFIGYLRLQQKYNSYDASWAILNKFKGKKIITKYLRKITKNSKHSYKATIREKNIASIKAALNAGFKIKKKIKSLVYMYK